jgi:hypothetical protein
LRLSESAGRTATAATSAIARPATVAVTMLAVSVRDQSASLRLVGRRCIRAVLVPRSAMAETTVMAAISALATPTSSAAYERATTSQKMYPRPELTPVVAMM